jgi:hypothetical protein
MFMRWVLESSHSVDPALLTNLALPDLHPLGSSSPKAFHQRAVVHSKAQNVMAEGWHLLWRKPKYVGPTDGICLAMVGKSCNGTSVEITAFSNRVWTMQEERSIMSRSRRLAS